MRRTVHGLAAALLLLISPLQAAQALDARQLHEDIVAALNSAAGPFSGVPLSYEEVTVWPRGEGYRVAITGLSTQPGPDGLWLDIGDIAYSLRETEPGFYRVSEFALPESIEVRDAEGNTSVLVTYDVQRLEGVWVSALANFLELDMLLTDVRAGSPDGEFRASLARLGAVSRADQEAQGLYSQAGDMRATDLRIEVPGEGGFAVREISGVVNVEAFDLDAYARLSAEMEALAGRGAEPSEEDMAALMQRMAGLNLLPRAFGERFSVSGLSVTDAEGQTLFKVDGAEMDLAGGGFDQPLAHLRFGLKHENLDTNGSLGAQAGPWKELMPRDAGLVMSLERLPAERLWQSVFKMAAFAFMQSAQEQQAPGQMPGQMDQMLMFMFMGEALPALTEAGTQLRLPHFLVASEAATLRAEGAFDVDPAAPQGLTGSLEMALTGLDRVIELLQAEIDAGNQDALGPMGMANWLKVMARREIGSDGQPADLYSLQITADGRTLLNGQPLGLPVLPQQ